MRVLLALSLQAAAVAVALRSLDFQRQPWVTGLLAPLASLPLGGAGILLTAVALTLGWSAGLVALSKPRGNGLTSWLRLLGWNVGGATVFCAISAACSHWWPVPNPYLTPYETDAAAKAEYVSWYECGYRDGLLGSPQTICVLGWSQNHGQGYENGYDAAFQAGPIEVVRRLLVGSRSWGTSAMAAFLRGDLKRADARLGKNVDARDSEGRTLLMMVGQSGLDVPDYVSDLIHKGADVNAADRFGYTPLMYAAQWERAEIVRLLIEAGASVTVTNGRGATPLHFAAGHGGDAVVTLMLNHGAVADAKDNRGATPLMWAATFGQAASAEALIAAGADVNARDSSGEPVVLRATWLVADKPNPALPVLLDQGADLGFAEQLKPWRRKMLLDCVAQSRRIGKALKADR